MINVYKSLLENGKGRRQFEDLAVDEKSRDNSVGIVMGYWLGGHLSIPGKGKKYLRSPLRTDLLWGPPNLRSGG
jgi:hypothetical protein